MNKKLTVFEFFQTLQLEWLIADLRSRIYPSHHDKAYWDKVKEGKRQKVESIADKNMLPTIFTDDEMKRIFETKVYGTKGHPNFTYVDADHERRQKPLDLTYYYAKNTDVRFEEASEMKVGQVENYTSPSTEILIVYNGERKTLPIDEVTRIL